MNTMISKAAVAFVVSVAAIGMAAPAAAEPLDGAYDATVTGGNVLDIGQRSLWVFDPCGPDCARRNVMGSEVEFHLQGDTWTGTSGNGVIETINADSLAATTNQPNGTISWQLHKGPR